MVWTDTIFLCVSQRRRAAWPVGSVHLGYEQNRVPNRRPWGGHWKRVHAAELAHRLRGCTARHCRRFLSSPLAFSLQRRAREQSKCGGLDRVRRTTSLHQRRGTPICSHFTGIITFSPLESLIIFVSPAHRSQWCTETQ